MATSTATRIRYETYVQATPEKLWQALTDPAMTQGYFYGSAIHSDFKPGSTIVSKGPDGSVMSDGTVVEAKPGERLVQTMRLAYDPEIAADRPSRVTWTIVPMGKVSQLVLEHDDFDGETRTYRDAVGGWPVIVSGLKTLVETGKPLEMPQGG